MGARIVRRDGNVVTVESAKMAYVAADLACLVGPTLIAESSLEDGSKHWTFRVHGIKEGSGHEKGEEK